MIGLIFFDGIQQKITDGLRAFPLHFDGETFGGLGPDMQIGKKENAPAVKGLRILFQRMAIEHSPERTALFPADLTGSSAVDPDPVVDRTLERDAVHSAGESSLARSAFRGAIDLTVTLVPSGRVRESPTLAPSMVSPILVL